MRDIVVRIYHSKPIFNHRTAWFLLLICFIFAILRIPSLIEPHWYGDEGIYQVVGRAIDSGRILYKEIWDNKPPVLYLLYASVYGNLFGIKLLSLLSGLSSVIVFFMLASKLFKKNKSRYLSTICYAFFFGLPILEGNIANAENFMLLPTIAAGYFVLRYTEHKKFVFLVFSGLLLAFSFVTKVVAIFDFLSFFTFLFLVNTGDVKKTLKPMLSYFFIYISLMVLFACYFFLRGSYGEYLSSVFFQNISYVGEENHLVFPLGMLLIKTIILVGAVGFIIFNRKRFNATMLFLYLWVAFSVYNAFFSERPYTHYLLVALPAVMLLVGHAVEKRKTRIVDVLVITVLTLVAFYYFQIYKKTIGYYANYFQFITNSKNIVEYESFFDSNTPRDYDIANFIQTNMKGNEKIFLLSDNAQIYALSNKLPIGKYIVAYHITFYKNADIITKQQIEKVQPKFIIQTVEDPLLNDLLSSYQLKYIMEGVKIYEREI